MRIIILLVLASFALAGCGKDQIENYFGNALQVTAYKNRNNFEGWRHVLRFVAPQVDTFNLEVVSSSGAVIAKRDWTPKKPAEELFLDCSPSHQIVKVVVMSGGRKEERSFDFSKATTHSEGMPSSFP